ncbi:MAG: LptE family protein [Deltaproteobacteria bacterium]|nr:LptE family protein [Deltaproteobacteria bacterium]
MEKKYAWALIFLLLSFSACGYRFAGSGNLPLGISSIHVNMFANNSRETGFENVITNDIIYEFTRKKKDSITKSDQADGILTGLVSSVRTDTIAREDAGTSLTRRITVSVNVKLTDRHGTVVWSEDNITESEAFDVISGNVANELRRKDVLNNISKRLAEKIFNRLTEDF